MTPHKSQIWNEAIQAAVNKHYKGIGAIKVLRVSMPVTVKHAPQTTEVAIETRGNNDSA